MTALHTPKRLRRIRMYQRFTDWLWQVLTRDLRPAPRPSHLSQACALLADLCRSGRSLVLPDSERRERSDT